MTLRNLALTLLGGLLVLPLATAAQSSRSVKAKLTWDIANTEQTSSLTLFAMVPASIERRQKVNSVDFSIAPDEYHTGVNGDSYAVFRFTSPDIPRQIVIRADIQLLRHGLNATSRKTGLPPGDLDKYLVDDEFLNIDHNVIKLLARKLKGRNDEETIDNIMNHISGAITYGKSPMYPRQGTLATLERATGICGDYSDLMIALCRASGIPARHACGFLFDRDFLPGRDDDSGHLWVEAYLPGYGWVDFEPTTGTHKGWRTMAPVYIYLSTDIHSTLTRGRYSFLYNGWPPRIDDFFSVK